MIGWTTVHDPEWTEEDMRFGLDWDLDQATACPGCGQPLAESTDPKWHQAYVAEPVDCHCCATTEREQRAHMAETDGKPLPGRRYRSRVRDGWQDPRMTP